MYFEDTTPEAFGLFVSWLYRQSIRDDRGALPQAHLIAKLWILGDKLLSVRVQNAAIEGKLLCVHLSRISVCFGSLTTIPRLIFPYFNAPATSFEIKSKLTSHPIHLGLCEQGWFGCNGSITEISYVYKHTKAGSPLRQLLIDQITHKAPYTSLAKAFTSKVQDFPNEMLVDLVLAQKKLLAKTNIATETLKAENYFIVDVGES